MSGSDSDPVGRHQRLLGIALKALVTEHAGPAFSGGPIIPTAFGAAVIGQESAGWVILDVRERDPASLLGAVMAWAIRAEVCSLRIISDIDSEVLRRRAAHWDLEVTVWLRDGRSITICGPALRSPVRPPDPEHLAFTDLITDAGAAVSIEHGVVAGEVRGLEICRVVDDPSGAARLQVGVGANDRLAFSMLYEGEPVEKSLRRVEAEVRTHRSLGAVRHPLNQLAKERFLRWYLEQSPEMVGARSLASAPGPIRRIGLSATSPCSAIGEDLTGRPILLICSVGIDLDVVPYAIDARLQLTSSSDEGPPGDLDDAGGRSRLVIAVPTRDLIAVQKDLAARIAPDQQWEPAEFVGIDWSAP